MRRRTAAVGVVLTGVLVLLAPAGMSARVRPAMPGDFNGDGYADLAIGVPYEDAGSKRDAGSVNIIYGSAGGLTAAGNQRWTQDSRGIAGIAEGGGGADGSHGPDMFGAALASGDFNRDGFADLAIGVPGDSQVGEGTVPGSDGPGSVAVLYGSSSGLGAAGDVRLWRTDLPAAPESRGGFGRRLAAGDFDGDGYPDLAVTGWESLGGEASAATVGVLYGGTGGLSAEQGVVLRQDMAASTNDEGYGWFGRALATGDLDGDGYADLVTATSTPDGAGGIAVFPGTPGGLSDTGEAWAAGADGVPGQPAWGDAFGSAIATGDLDGDGFDDVAIGAPSADLDGIFNAGTVTTLRGSAEGLTATGAQLWHESTPGVPGKALAADGFGYAVAIGDLDGDGPADLAIGVHQKPPGGTVVVLYGAAGGLTASRAQQWSQDSPGVPDHREKPDRFGSSLVIANFGKSGKADLAIGAKHERLHGVTWAGLVNVLYGHRGGLTSTGAQAWSQDTAGIKGTVETVDQFGSVLAP